jgi:NADPH2:quinone reductase
MSLTSSRVVLASRPAGEPTADNFRFETQPVPELSDGQIAVRTVYLSLDPYMRGRMSDAKSYAKPVELGDVMEGATVGEVVASRSADIAVGQYVVVKGGWQTYSVVDAAGATVLDRSQPLSTALGVLGMPGFTAWAGLTLLGHPMPGETVVVAAATGPVGATVGQVAKALGARAVGIAGGPKKTAALLDEFGFDAAVDHKAPDFKEQLKAAVPDGIDVYFENVGGPVARAVVPLMNLYGRMPVCGLISQYNGAEASDKDHLPAFMNAILVKSLTVRGFIQSEFTERHREQFQAEMGPWVRDGVVKYREEIIDGLEIAPAAFIGLLRGENFGKRIIRVAEEQTPVEQPADGD